MIIVCFSGKSAKTQLLIRDMYHYKQKESKKHTCIISAINEIVRDLERAITASNIYDILNAITMNRIWLQTLAQQSNIVLETPELTRLINVAQKHGAAAKFSGAGGGDCCLALCTDHTKAEKIINEWRSIGALPIEVSVL
jgi:phosphomevalonate kinase